MLFSVFGNNLEQLVPVIPLGESIPHYLYQTYPDPSALPVELSDNIAHLKQLNPDWQHRLFSDADIRVFLTEEYPALLAYYDQISPAYGAAKADFFRYLLVYRYGGVYVDIKSTINKPLSATIRASDRFLLSNWHEWQSEPGFKGWGKHWELAHVDGGEFQQWHIVSVAGHPYLRAVILAVLHNIKSYHPRWFGVGKLGVLRTTGPIAYTLAVASICRDNEAGLINIRSDYGFEYSIYGKDVHLEKFVRHYSKNTTPVIQKGMYRTVLAFWAGAIKKVARRLVRIMR